MLKGKLVAVLLVLFSLVAVAAVWAPGSEETGVRYVLSADGKMMKILEGDKVLFLSGVGADAQQISSVDIKGQQTITSPHGKAVALCSQYVNKTGPVVVYDNIGRKLGQFEVELPWKVAEVSDDGQLVALTKVLGGRSPFVVRLCDLKGTVLAEYGEDPTFCAFTSSGVPLVWGAHRDTRDPFVSVLDKKGRAMATWQYPDQERWVYQVGASDQAAVVAVLDGPKSKPPDTVTVWTRKNIALPKDLGEAQKDNIAISADGSFLALRLGATSISLISTPKSSVVLGKDVSLMVGEGNKITAILRIVQVDNDGTITANCLMESGKYIVIEVDAKGELTRSLAVGG